MPGGVFNLAVSIHARVERATCDCLSAQRRRVGFNPRTRRACDTLFAIRLIKSLRFNPRTRRACDLPCLQLLITAGVSIHARVERATRRYVLSAFRRREVSIHARVERATTFVKSPPGRTSGFNPRTRRACDDVCKVSAREDVWFQSTHA